jgi:hypothetical protein
MNIKIYQDRRGQWRALVEDGTRRIWTLPLTQRPDHPVEFVELRVAQRAAFALHDARAQKLVGDHVEVNDDEEGFTGFLVEGLPSARFVPRPAGVSPYLLQDPTCFDEGISSGPVPDAESAQEPERK